MSTCVLKLDPVKAIPAFEAWLFDPPVALAAVKQGLKESGAGKRIDRGSFARQAKSSRCNAGSPSASWST
jgi:hypothetical protein